MTSDFRMYLEGILRQIDTSLVISIFFPTFRRSLLIDARSTLENGPMVKIMPSVSSPDERLRSVERLRPYLPRPKQKDLLIIPWPKQVSSLVSLGVWERIITRFVDAGQKDTVKVCSMALEKLRHLERAEMVALIRGENYRTIWSRN